MMRFIYVFAVVSMGCAAVEPMNLGVHGGEETRALRGDTVVLADSVEDADAVSRATLAFDGAVGVSVRGSAESWDDAREQWRLVRVSEGFEILPGRPACLPDANGVHLFEYTSRATKTIYVGDCVPSASPIITHAVFHMAGATHAASGLMHEEMLGDAQPSSETLEELRQLYE